MSDLLRRDFLRAVATTAVGSSLLSDSRCDAFEPRAADDLHVAPFRFDVTPPIGHGCCGGWIKPVEIIDDSLEAIGFVLLGAGAPVVICAVDWTGLLNEAHAAFRMALADGAGTTPDRVAVHCVHQHNAPFACIESQRIVAAQGDLPAILDLSFFEACLERGNSAIRAAVNQPRRVTHIAVDQARVDRVASNRRVSRDDHGRIKAMRGSSCRDAVLRDLPEGLIDPWLKTVAFYEGDQKRVALHYYATHPMSYYGDGRVSSDFVGLARKQRQRDELDCVHAYFTGCAGNIAAGKYNDGSQAMRPVLTQRIYEAMVRSESQLRPVPVELVQWKSVEVLPPPHPSLSADAIELQIANKSASVVNRNRPSFQLAWLRRHQRRFPIVVSALHLGAHRLLHLPAESFVEYQLRAQSFHADGTVATAAYGDGGPWYIPTKDEYPNGGYEVSVAFCDAQIDDDLTRAIRQVL